MTEDITLSLAPKIKTVPGPHGCPRRPVLAVVGASAKKARGMKCTPPPEVAVRLGTRWNTETERMARLVGKWAAEAGFVVLTGGMTGVMEAAITSARMHGALTMSILPGEAHDAAVAPAEIILPTSLGYARNWLTALGCDLMIALPGGQGTLQEMSIAADYGRTVVSWDSWKLPELVRFYAAQEEAGVERFIKSFEPVTRPGPGSETP